MFYSDYHMHSSFSSDSEVPMSEMIKQAIRLGLKEIAITDHQDYDYPQKNYPFLLNYDYYKQTFNNCQNAYGKNIKLKFGIEIGLQPQAKHNIKAFASNNYFDFIIGSLHCIDGEELCNNSFFYGRRREASYKIYFERVLETIKIFDCFDVYGHLDYINRYGDFSNKSMASSDYFDIIDEILKLLILKGKGLEINTSGYAYGLGTAHPQKSVLKRYKELGGEIITIGSDAHSPDKIAYGFKEAYSTLNEVGFNYITTFTERKPDFIKI